MIQSSIMAIIAVVLAAFVAVGGLIAFLLNWSSKLKDELHAITKMAGNMTDSKISVAGIGHEKIIAGHDSLIQDRIEANQKQLTKLEREKLNRLEHNLSCKIRLLELRENFAKDIGEIKKCIANIDKSLVILHAKRKKDE